MTAMPGENDQEAEPTILISSRTFRWSISGPAGSAR